jgi:type IV pilus assembly protein PilA
MTIGEDAIVNTKFKAQLLQSLARKSSQPGNTLVDCLVLMVILMILAVVALPSLLSSADKAKQVEARNNIGAMNRAQQSYHLDKGKFADSIGQIGLGIRNSSNYEYSIEKTPLATFQYGTPLHEDLKSYVGIVVASPSPENSDEISAQAILCEQNEPGVQPSEPIVEDGVIQCGENMKSLDGSGKIEVGQELEVAYWSWELASEGKYGPALKLTQTITDDWHKDSALSVIASELAGAGEYESALEIAETITYDWQKSWALEAITLHLANDAQYDRALELAASTNQEYKVNALKAIAPHLTSDAQYNRALEMADYYHKELRIKPSIRSDRPSFN